jgi:hypothetical protein
MQNYVKKFDSNLRHVGGFCWLVEDIAENIVESGIKRYKPLMKYCIAVKPCTTIKRVCNSPIKT